METRRDFLRVKSNPGPSLQVAVRDTRAEVCRRTAIQPLRVIRQKLGRMVGLRQQSTFAQTFNWIETRTGSPAKCDPLKARRSPTCRSRSTQERVNDDPDRFRPPTHLAQ